MRCQSPYLTSIMMYKNSLQSTGSFVNLSRSVKCMKTVCGRSGNRSNCNVFKCICQFVNHWQNKREIYYFIKTSAFPVPDKSKQMTSRVDRKKVVRILSWPSFSFFIPRPMTNDSKKWRRNNRKNVQIKFLDRNSKRYTYRVAPQQYYVRPKHSVQLKKNINGYGILCMGRGQHSND